VLRREPGVALSVMGGGPDVPGDARNLAWRAAEAFFARAPTPQGVEIRLAKRVPSGAGLGGGSSDAGAVLRGLATLLPGAVSAEALREAALGLGADVPYFLDPRPAEVSGVGERIVPAAGLPELPLLVVHPGVALGTKDVYAGYAETRHPDATAAAPLPALEAPLDRDRWAARVRNDLEASAVRLCPRIAALERALVAAGALAAGMSGSGSAVYGVFASAAERDGAGERIDLAPGERAFATATMASP